MLLNKSNFLAVSIFICCALANTAFAHADGGIVVKDAWVREAPPSATVLAAYMTIENHTDKDKVLTSVTSSVFNKIEMHKTVNKDGMASMEQQKELTIAAESEVKLEPGGFHLMLFNPAKQLKVGDDISFTLKFASGSTSIVNATVKKAMGSSEHHHHSEQDEHKMHEHH
ncbi:copper chaperone PCu(A)C [Kaarinaea lacus]